MRNHLPHTRDAFLMLLQTEQTQIRQLLSLRPYLLCLWKYD